MEIIMLSAGAAIAAILAVSFLIYSGRNPVREINPGKNIVSPADGTVISVTRPEDLRHIKSANSDTGFLHTLRSMSEEISARPCIIQIHVGCLDVMSQRAPVEGDVVSIKRAGGKRAAAAALDAISKNSRNEIVIKNKSVGKVKVVQAAGMLGKPLCQLKHSEKLLKGEKIGRLQFGGQVALIIPEMRINAVAGQKVLAGETVIAEF